MPIISVHNTAHAPAINLRLVLVLVLCCVGVGVGVVLVLCCVGVVFSPGLLQQQQESTAGGFGGSYVAQRSKHTFCSDHVVHGHLRVDAHMSINVSKVWIKSSV